MNLDHICEYLTWDSDFFEVRIARILENQLTSETMKTIMEWCNVNRIDCIYFLCNIDDEITVRLVENHGFSFVDVRVLLKMNINQTLVQAYDNSLCTIRPSALEDIPALRSIAKEVHRSTRFYFDKHFPTSQCDALYETWIDKSCRDYADIVFVADIREQPIGYITCHILGDDKGQIGLVGVENNWRGKGLGQQLVNESLRWFESKDVTQVKVVTQGRNYSAQRLYQRSGFFTEEVQLWYHRWFSYEGSK